MLSAFTLHSLPGADHVIYLDFDGHTTSGTDWNNIYNAGKPIVSPPYDRDGRPEFSDAELAEIEHIWQRVSEDFAPFNVDVTTEDPGLERLRKTIGDTQWGVRAIQTADQSWLVDNVGHTVGGIAWIGSFNYSSDTPVFSFNGGEVAAADTLSHEVGHALGLSHAATGKINPDGSLTIYSEYYYGHGSGETGWAPIMGAGFAKNLSQWSQGEYPDAYPEIGHYYRGDQLNVIATVNGFGYRQDMPDTLNNELVHQASGIIETRTDTDGYYFHVWSKSSVTLRVRPAERGANLDAEMTLSDGTKAIAVVNPVDRLDAELTMVLEQGTYFVSIDGVGKAAVAGDPGYSDYGSLGQYTVTLELAELDEPVFVSESGAVVETPDRILPWSITEVQIKGTWKATDIIIVGRQGVIPCTFRVENGVSKWTFSPIKADRLDIRGLVEKHVDILFGDVNGDGVVNLIDALLQRGRNGTADPFADLNGDGVVNLTDAYLLRSLNGSTLN